jgi:hypothetical protein
MRQNRLEDTAEKLPPETDPLAIVVPSPEL